MSNGIRKIRDNGYFENVLLKMNLFAVIMAGGKGERFWPAGRISRPKQMLSLTGDKSMIEETVLRLFPLIQPDHVLVITNKKYVKQIQDVLPIPAENVIGEPEGRDTAPCVALAAALVRRKDPGATMILLPADHMIRPTKLFQEKLLSAAEAAQSGALVTLGITPTYPATGYGYLHLGASVENGFHKVLEFKEKPDRTTAEMFLREGHYHWNSGMFIWRADVISEAFRKYVPELGKRMDAWAGGADFTLDFSECPKISIDYAVMEKADNVIAGDTHFEWSDVGSWSSLKTLLPADEDGNVCKGNVVTLDSKGSVLFSDDDTLIGVIGMQNVAVVKSGNGILVCPLSEEQKVKNLVEQMQTIVQEFI